MTLVLKDNGLRKLPYDPERHREWIVNKTTLSPLYVDKIVNLCSQDENITSDEIYQTVINVLVENTEETAPHFQFEASKVFMARLYKNVSKLRSYDAEEKYSNFYGLIRKFSGEGHYHPHLFEKYTKEEIKQCGEMIVPERDELFTHLGIETLAGRYLSKTFDGEIFELPQERWIVIAMWIMQDEDKDKRMKLIEEAYWAMSNLLMTVATPTLANAGKTHAQLSSCFPGETEVSTVLGDKAIRDIKVGDEVLTHDGSFKKVTELHVRENIDKKLIELSLVAHPSKLRATPEHPFLVLVDTNKEEDENRIIKSLEDGVTKNLKWVKAEDIKPKDYLVIGTEFLDMEKGISEISSAEYISSARLTEDNGWLYEKISETSSKFSKHGKNLNSQISPVPEMLKLDYEFGKVAGLFLADGYIEKNKDNIPRHVSFVMGTVRDKDSIDFINNWSKKVLNKEVSEFENKKDGSTKISICGKFFAQIMNELFGENFETKRLPLEKGIYNKEFLLGLMQGVFLGDGTITKRGLKLQMTNPQIIKQMYNVLLNLEVYPAYREVLTASGKIAGILDLHIKSEREREFALAATHDSEKLSNLLNDVDFSKSYSFSKVQGYNLKRVSSVSEMEHEGQVYNLDVEENHTYVADGIVVHNCFIDIIDDSLDSIYGSNHDIANLSKYGGGIGKLMPM